MDENSTPDESWTQQPCKIVGRSKTYSEAEDIVNRLEMVTDSEDAQDMTQGTCQKENEIWGQILQFGTAADQESYGT